MTEHDSLAERHSTDFGIPASATRRRKQGRNQEFVHTKSPTGGLDAKFDAVFAALPVGWRFKAIQLCSKQSNQRRPGWWYASASGPDPDRPSTSFGFTGIGRPGIDGIDEALVDLIDQLESLR